MQSYIRRAGKKYKDGVRREAPLFRYIDTAMYLGQQPKWSGETPGSFGANEEGSKLGGPKGPEPAIKLEGGDIKLVTETWDTEM